MVQGHGMHRGRGRGAGGDLDDRRAQLDAAGLRAPPRQRGECVRSPRLRREHNVVTEAFGFQDSVEGIRRRLGRPVAELQGKLHANTSPPLVSSVWPVMTEARSEAKNTAALAQSPSGGRKPRGMAETISASCSSMLGPPLAAMASNMPRTGGPSIQPGTTELTRILYGPNSLASTWAAVSSAPFDAA